ncbi:hypothetical protein DVK07_14170 [Halorubrum sp. Atlit-26R]|nr:hypothetical protein DVK07_14170 [Halorubrum sp. Atlit-26R]
MSGDNIVDLFAATIISVVGIVIMVSLYNPDLGQLLVGILPTFVEFMVYLLIIGILGSMIYQLFD